MNPGLDLIPSALHEACNRIDAEFEQGLISPEFYNTYRFRWSVLCFQATQLHQSGSDPIDNDEFCLHIGDFVIAYGKYIPLV